MPAPVLPADFKAIISNPTATLCGNFINTLLKGPTLLYQLVNYLFDSDGNLTTVFKKIITDLTIRPGDLVFSAALEDTDGRLLCNGAAVSRATYADLFLAIGTMYGVGDGATTFQLPDFRDRFPIGASGTRAIGTTGGAETATLELLNVPPHSHDCPAVGQAGGGGSGAELFQANEVTNVNQTDRTLVTNKAGGTGSPSAAAPFDVVNPWLACFVYVKT